MKRKQNWFKNAVHLCTAILLSWTITACDSTENVDSEQPKKLRVALIMKSLANEFFINMADGAKAHQATKPDTYELLVNGIKNESDLAQQVSLVEQMMASRVDVIVIAPADSKSLLPVIKRAVDQGITVVNIDNRFDRDILQQMGLTIPFVGPDNKEGAQMVGEYLAKQLQTGDQVAIIGGIVSAFNAQQRAAGFQEAMTTAGMNVVSVQSADWDQAKAASITAAILSENPEIKAVLAANDSMALGAVAAVRQANKLTNIAVVGFDNISAANELVQSGEMLATADQHGSELAVFGIEYALEILKTGKAPADKKTPVDLIIKGKK